MARPSPPALSCKFEGGTAATARRVNLLARGEVGGEKKARFGEADRRLQR